MPVPNKSIELDEYELHLLKLWYLSCEDMQIAQGGCSKCSFAKICSSLNSKLGLGELDEHSKDNRRTD